MKNILHCQENFPQVTMQIPTTLISDFLHSVDEFMRFSFLVEECLRREGENMRRQYSIIPTSIQHTFLSTLCQTLF